MEVQPLGAWQKSSYSLNEDATCVEVAPYPQGLMGVRDSTDPDGPVLLFPCETWASFVNMAKEYPAAAG